MRSRVRVWIVVASLVVLHFVLHVGFGLGPAAPDLLTVALLIGARETGLGTAAGLGLAFGLLEDALSVLSFGANSVAMTVVGTAGGVSRDLFVGDSLVFLASYFWIGKWVRELLRWVVVREELRHPFVDQILVQAPIGGLYAAAVGVVIVTLSGLWREAPR